MIYPKGISGGGDVFINGNTVYHSANINTQVYDWNTYTPAPFKSAEATVANAPTTGEYYYGTSLRFHRSSDTYFADIVSGLYSDRLFYRRHDDTGYKNWLEIYHTGNLAPVTLNTEQYITANKTFVGGINGFVKQASKANPTEQPVFINGTGGATLGESAAIGFHNPGRNYSSIVYHDGLFKFMNSVMGGYDGIIASTANFTNLTTSYLPKHSASGLANSIIFDNGTNVGIGTTDPTTTLDVAGTGRFTGTVTAPTFIGSLSGTATNASALNSKSSTYYTDYDERTLGNSVNFNNITYDFQNRPFIVSPVYPQNYTGQTNTPFIDYGQMITFGGLGAVFPFQLAVSDAGKMAFRCKYRPTNNTVIDSS